MGIIKTFNQWLNEGYNPPERSHVYSLLDDQLQEELRKYVEDYYKQFPEKFKEDQEEGQSSINWGELESPEYIVANYVSDLLVTSDFEEESLSEKDKNIVDLAWKIADYYLENGYSEGYASDEEDDFNELDDENCSVETLYDYLIDSYESLGNTKIELESGKTEDGVEWNSIQIPITLSGEHIITEIDAEDPSKIFAVDFTKGLKDDVLETEYYEIDDENINDDEYERVFFSNSNVKCSEVINFLDELLELVSDPALRKK